MLVVVEVVTFVAIEAVAKMLRVVRWQPSAEEIPATEVQLQLHPPPLLLLFLAVSLYLYKIGTQHEVVTIPDHV